MNTIIIAGGFTTKTLADEALSRLRAAGVLDSDLCEFRVNPAGEHDRTPIGGDHDESAGAHEADAGAIKGVAIGGAVGLAAGAAAALVVGPLALPIGAGVGAYTGSLLGGLSEMKPTNLNAIRAAGAMVAVNSGASEVSDEVIVRILHECGADPVERAEGTWADGEWSDFDPLRPPNRVAPPSSTASVSPLR